MRCLKKIPGADRTSLVFLTGDSSLRVYRGRWYPTTVMLADRKSRSVSRPSKPGHLSAAAACRGSQTLPVP